MVDWDSGYTWAGHWDSGSLTMETSPIIVDWDDGSTWDGGWDIGNPIMETLKAWRYRRWATHAKQHSPSRIQAQWVAVWSAEPISFGHL